MSSEVRSRKWETHHPNYYHEWRIHHPNYHRAYHAEKRMRLQEAAFAKLGNRCSNPACQWLNADGTRGCMDRRCLQIDHVNNDGYKGRYTIGRKGRIVQAGPEARYKEILADQENRFQILCANCNWIKKEIFRLSQLELQEN